MKTLPDNIHLSKTIPFLSSNGHEKINILSQNLKYESSVVPIHQEYFTVLSAHIH